MLLLDLAARHTQPRQCAQPLRRFDLTASDDEDMRLEGEHASIPDGRESPARVIPLFDERASRAPLDTGKHVIFVCAPKAFYSGLRYASAVNSVVLLNSVEAKFLFAAALWRDSAHWRSTYRQMLAEVTHCYCIVHSDGSIAAGAWAELNWLTRPGSPLCYLAAFAAPNEQSHHNLLRSEGYFKPVHPGEWFWDNAARLHFDPYPSSPKRSAKGVKVRAGLQSGSIGKHHAAKEKSDAGR